MNFQEVFEEKENSQEKTWRYPRKCVFLRHQKPRKRVKYEATKPRKRVKSSIMKARIRETARISRSYET